LSSLPGKAISLLDEFSDLVRSETANFRFRLRPPEVLQRELAGSVDRNSEPTGPVTWDIERIVSAVT
jgi:hypothetical protein